MSSNERIRSVFLVWLFVLSTLVTGCAKNPVGGTDLAFMSREEEIELGREHYPKIIQMHEGELQGKAVQNYVEDLGRQLTRVSHRPNLPYQFNVVNSSTPNAYALPGGFISITRGLLLEIENEKQLAAILGHEIGHVTARHAVQQQSSQVLTGILLTAANIYMRSEGVENPGLYSDIGEIGASAMLASYSRSQERQSDKLGLQYMTRAGYDPHGMIEIQRLLLELREEKPNFIQQLFSTHPLSENRIQHTRKLISQEDYDRVSDTSTLNRFEPVVAKTWKPRKPAYDSMDTGIEKLKNDRPETAVHHFRVAIDVYSGEALFHAWLGKALTEIDQLDQGREALDKALEINDKVYRIPMFSAINYLELGSYDKSLSQLNRVESLLQEYPETNYFRGRNYEELGDLPNAIKFYRKYLHTTKHGKHADDACEFLDRDWSRHTTETAQICAQI